MKDDDNYPVVQDESSLTVQNPYCVIVHWFYLITFRKVSVGHLTQNHWNTMKLCAMQDAVQKTWQYNLNQEICRLS